MNKSKLTKTITLGICFATLSSSIALANGEPVLLPSKLPAKQIQAEYIQPVEANILPAYGPDTPVSSTAVQVRDINEAMLQKQREIDKYLFEDHAEEINQQNFNVTHTGPFDNYVEIGITPYSEENAEYLYNIFGKDGVKVVEGHQAVTLPGQEAAQDIAVAKPALESDVRLISADASEPAFEYENQLIRKDNVVRVKVNGEFLQLDVDPFIENNRTLIPLRGVMESLGAEVKWNQEEQKVEVYTEDVTIELVIGEDTAKVTSTIDGKVKDEVIKLEVPAKLVENRTFIPGRFVSETLGATVDWDNSLRAMIIETADMNDKVAVENLVKNFGKKLKMVSLLAPEDILSKSMEENYGEFVSSELLEKWKNDPQNAPGSLTSSPWPDRIEIVSVDEIAEHEYEVKGEIIEVSSTEVKDNGVAAKRLITLSVKKDNNNWVITDFQFQPLDINEPTVEEKFETKGSYEIKDDKIIFDFELINHHNESKKLQFGSGQQFEIVVTDKEGEEVYRYSDGKFFTQALVFKTIEPNGSIKWQAEWDMTNKEGEKLPSGEYSAEISILVIPEENNENIEKDQLKTVIELAI